MDWIVKERKKIYAMVILILIIFLVFLLLPAVRLSFLGIFKGTGLKTIKPQISAYEELRYLWTFNTYPPMDLSKGENFTLSQSKEGKNKLVSTFDFDADLGQTENFFKTYLTKNGYSGIKEERKNDFFAVSAIKGEMPLSISAEKISDLLTRVTLVFEAKFIIRKPLHK